MNTYFTPDIIMLRKLMIENNINTLTELSKKSGINTSTLSNVFKGKTKPSTEVMEKLVASLRIEPKKAGEIFFTCNLRKMQEIRSSKKIQTAYRQ